MQKGAERTARRPLGIGTGPTDTTLTEHSELKMAQVFEFAGNHPLLIFAFFASLGMIVFSEYMRFANSGKALSPYAATQMLNSHAFA